MQGLEATLIERMKDAIVAQLMDYQIREPVYTVVLTYCTELGEDLPPWISVGTQRERRAMLKEEEELDSILWNGELMELYDPVEALLEDVDFMDLCAQWSVENHGGGHPQERVTALMQRLCFALQKIDWQTVFPITDDFVVTACTQEGDWLAENMSVLLPPEQYEAFVKKGYVPPVCACDEEE